MTDQVADALAKMQTDEGYFTYGAIAWNALNSGQREQLRQLLFQGPIWDGFIISKSARDDLIDYGLATRCCFMGEQGYTAATYLAYSVHEQGKGTPMPKKRGVDDRGLSAAAQPTPMQIAYFVNAVGKLAEFESQMFATRGFGAFDRSSVAMPDTVVVDVLAWLKTLAGGARP